MTQFWVGKLEAGVCKSGSGRMVGKLEFGSGSYDQGSSISNIHFHNYI